MLAPVASAQPTATSCPRLRADETTTAIPRATPSAAAAATAVGVWRSTTTPARVTSTGALPRPTAYVTPSEPRP